jgi:hypothetical protein
MMSRGRITIRHYLEDVERGTPPALIASRAHEPVGSDRPDPAWTMLSASSPVLQLPPGTYRLLTVVDLGAGRDTPGSASPIIDMHAVHIDRSPLVWRGVVIALAIEIAFGAFVWAALWPFA